MTRARNNFPQSPKVPCYPDDPLHCERCHETFFEFMNGRKSCNIPHTFEYISTPPEVGQHICSYKCCGGVAMFSLDGQMTLPASGRSEMCYQGRHTTDAAVVKYNGINIHECEPGEDPAECWRDPIRVTEPIQFLTHPIRLAAKALANRASSSGRERSKSGSRTPDPEHPDDEEEEMEGGEEGLEGKEMEGEGGSKVNEEESEDGRPAGSLQDNGRAEELQQGGQAGSLQDNSRAEELQQGSQAGSLQDNSRAEERQHGSQAGETWDLDPIVRDMFSQILEGQELDMDLIHGILYPGMVQDRGTNPTYQTPYPVSIDIGQDRGMSPTYQVPNPVGTSQDGYLTNQTPHTAGMGRERAMSPSFRVPASAQERDSFVNAAHLMPYFPRHGSRSQ